MRLKFNDLPRAVRERLVKLTSKEGEKDHRVLLFEADWAGGWFKYFTALGSTGVILFCLHFLMQRGRAGIHPRHDEEVFMGLAAGTFVLGVSVISMVIRQLWKPPPYREGRWVFPSGLTKLSGGWVDFLPISQLGRPTLVTVKRNGSYTHSRLELGHPFTFTFGSPQSADKATDSVLKAKQQMIALIAARDSGAIAALDPFAECTLSGNWTAPPSLGMEDGPTAAMVPTPVRLAQWLAPLAIAGAAAAGAFAFFSVAYQHH